MQVSKTVILGEQSKVVVGAVSDCSPKRIGSFPG